MAQTALERTGLRYGRWIVLRRSAKKARRVWWIVKCDCGTVREMEGCRLPGSGGCGCKSGGITHGDSHSAEYNTWSNIIQRCTNPNNSHFANYGNRGISVCERWKTYENFLADMGRRPARGLTIDRIDNDGNYEPGNCRWATYSVQASNQRPRRLKEACKRGHQNWRQLRGQRARVCRTCNTLAKRKSRTH